MNDLELTITHPAWVYVTIEKMKSGEQPLLFPSQWDYMVKEGLVVRNETDFTYRLVKISNDEEDD
jgi:hypothetical protein